MRIGLVIYGELSYTSGGFLYDTKVVERLRAEGDEVVVISLPWRSYRRHLFDNFSPRLRRQLATQDLDVLIQDELNHPSLFLLNRFLERFSRTPIVAIVHHLRSREEHPGLLRAFYRGVERIYLRSVDGMVCVSETTHEDVERLVGGKTRAVVCRPAGDRWETLPGVAEIEARARRGGMLNVIFLGNAIRRKGLHTLIEAVGMLKPDCCSLTVVGQLDSDAEYVRQIREQIARKGLSERVSLLGPLEAEAVGQALRQADVLAVPSAYEGFGIVYLEGMAFGLPAIAGAAGAAGEIVREGETGFLVDYGDAAGLAQRLEMLAENRARLGVMSAAAQAYYLAQPTWAMTTNCVRKFLRSMAADAIIGERPPLEEQASE